MKAITLHQPWAQLCVTDVCPPGHGPHPVKWIETRSWPAPAGLVGQRIAVHAAAKVPAPTRVGAWTTGRNLPGGAWMSAGAEVMSVRLPLGVVVGSAVLAACLPIETPDSEIARAERIVWTSGARDLKIARLDRRLEGTDQHPWITEADVSDQLPYGDFAPGRWAWILADAAPTTERCPVCWGDGWKPGVQRDEWGGADKACPACGGPGRCAPIPATGRQRVWNWNPVEADR